jgi:broad specificity phosphatase PhoE
MELYLIRHGDMAGDPHQHYAPPVADCLSELGCRQAAAMGESLKDVRFDAIYASPLGRAVQTAQTLSEPRGLKIGLLPWLIEWRPATVMGECDETAYEAMMAKAAEIRPEQAWKTPAGEGTLEMGHRIIPNFLKLMVSHGVHAGHGGYLLDNAKDEQRLALVAHGGSLGLLAAFILGVPLRPYGPIAFAQAGVAVFSFVRRVDVWYPTLLVPGPTCVANAAPEQLTPQSEGSAV